MSKGHMIMLGGLMERHDASDVTFKGQDDLSKSIWPSIKRSPGGHRIATYLREQGYDVEVLDFWPAWTRLQLLQFFHQNIREDTLAIGLSSMFTLGQMGKDAHAKYKVIEMLQTMDYLKDLYPQVKFVGGAQNLSALTGYNLDYYVSGYGEYAIVELFKYFKGEFNTLTIQQKKIGGGTINLIDCQNDYPAFPMPNAAVKYEERDYIEPQEVLTLELARGCKFKCKFCSYPVLGVKGDYSRCADSLKEELLDNYTRWGVTNYTVSDETINDSPEKLAKHAKVIRELPFQPHLSGFVRADLLVNKPETWQDIYDMGLRSHYYGIETFHQPAGKIVGKGINTDKLKEGLLKVQDWFKNKEEGRGDFHCEISMIIGLPEETRETFLDGIEWLKTKFSGYSYAISPLYMANDKTPMMNHSSEFDRTWRESGIFHEMTNEEMGVDESELNPNTAQHAIDQLVKSNRLKWAHSTMNIWEAFKVFDEILNDEDLVKNTRPGIFYYHRYLTTNKYTIDDIYRKQFSNEVSDDVIHPINYNDIDDHTQFIQKYIFKKLNQ
jgi:radical SAM superfamily enzyme YgiQ (UPF0313 family)